MASVILVPLIIFGLLIVLYILLSPKRKQDSPAAAQFQLKQAMQTVESRLYSAESRTFKFGVEKRKETDENFNEILPEDSAVGVNFNIKELKKLDIMINKAKSNIERAKFEDIYDMTVPYKSVSDAREITQSLILAQPEDNEKYLRMIFTLLQESSTFISTYCGVHIDDEHKLTLKGFNRKAKEDKAKKHLSSLDK